SFSRMRSFLLLTLLVIAGDAKSIRQKRSISEFVDPYVAPSIASSDSSNNEQINSYKTMLESLLRQLSSIEQTYYLSENPPSPDALDEYQREYYTQQASEITQKLIQYGAYSAMIDAENTAFYEDTDDENESAEPVDLSDVDVPLAQVRLEETMPSSADNGEEPFTDEQAHEILKMLVEEMMDKVFADMKNAQVFVVGASSKKNDDDEDPEPTSESDKEDDSSSSSSEENDEYYYGDYDIKLETDDDAVIVVNKQVSTNLIRIPATTFVDALTKLLPTFKSPYPQNLQQKTPLQVEDVRVYGPNGDPKLVDPSTILPRVSAHSVRPIASVPSPTAAAAIAEYTTESWDCPHAFDLGHILLCIAAGLLALWAIAQLISMYRKRKEPAAPAHAAPLPAKEIPSIIPNIYATPPPVLSRITEAEKPPVYVETPIVHKPEV
ncbi:hypothetical protein PMAYCL1PPCAC_08205, partial [Pristionchus mayeri]